MSINPKVFKQVRKALGLSQQELADAIGLSRVTINKMERGKLARGIPDEIAARLLSLKKRTLADAARETAERAAFNLLNVKGAVTGRWEATDDHLWDNEEDES